nr:flagellar assembly protein FliW [Lentibacillus sediminis]
MHIQTKYLGELEMDASKIIQFPAGIPGFKEETAFVLLDLPDNQLFQVLQSVQTVDVAFIVLHPFDLYPDYAFDLDDTMAEILEINKREDVVVLTIVTLKNPFAASTINLKAPILINPNRRLGKQYILNQDELASKAPITPEVAKVKGE